MAGKDFLLSIRVPVDLVKRATRLTPKVGRDPAVTTVGRVTRSTVIKLALRRGLDALEAEYK